MPDPHAESESLGALCDPRGLSVIHPEGRADGPAGATWRSFDPAQGQWIGPEIHSASPAAVRQACDLASQAFDENAVRSKEDRAGLLRGIADNLVGLGDALVRQACQETGLAPARITAERDRTVFQLRMFADVVKEGNWVDAVIDHGDPARTPLPRPDVRRMLRPLGPVAVFGASNFPLAYSVAGGDTASALAAGCPVIVKGHGAHPLTGEMTARAVAHAARVAGWHPGTFAFLHAGGERDLDVGRELVLNPNVRAVGFTGSVKGGTSLVALSTQRTNRFGPDPIPVFAEMGSVNPVVVLPGAIESDAANIAARLASSATNSSGQMCTCPGLIILIDSGASTDAFVDALAHGVTAAGEMTMLTARTRDLLRERWREVERTPGVRRLTQSSEGHSPGIATRAALFAVSGEAFVRHPTLSEECFGPSAIVVRCRSADELLGVVQHALPGSLTGSMFMAASDEGIAPRVLALLSRLAGRVIVGGVPTGVEVCAAMVHAGPFPACSRPDSSAVGRTALARWCRPVCYQNVPEHLLPPELREANPLSIVRV
ncbi:MAG: aldehyde dehydrogenase (NADP(+)) [Phycisphaerales bacterium]